MSKMRIDRQKNELYLRIIVNSLCNSKCYFCHREGVLINKELDRDILINAVKDSAKSGFKKVKYTGGEPLLRKDLAEITSEIKRIDKDIEISMTTNGFLLKKKLDDLVEAGLDRFNISLHSIDRDNFKRIYGVDRLNDVIEGIEYAVGRGIRVKVNMTVSTYNLHEIPQIGAYAKSKGIEFRIHNLLPFNKEAADTLVSLNNIKDYLASISEKIEDNIKDEKRVTTYSNSSFSVDIKDFAMSSKCRGCRDIQKCGEGIYAVRLDPKGILHPCLYRTDLQMDYSKALKEGNSVHVIKEAFERAAA